MLLHVERTKAMKWGVGQAVWTGRVDLNPQMRQRRIRKAEDQLRKRRKGETTICGSFQPLPNLG